MPTPQELWNCPLDDPYVGADGKKREPKAASVFVTYGAANAAYAVEEAKRVRAELDDLKAKLPGIVASAVADAVVDVIVTVRDRNAKP